MINLYCNNAFVELLTRVRSIRLTKKQQQLPSQTALMFTFPSFFENGNRNIFGFIGILLYQELNNWMKIHRVL
jgi:hypothetical protein